MTFQRRGARLLQVGLILAVAGAQMGCKKPIPEGRYLLGMRTGSLGAPVAEVALDLTRGPGNRWEAALLNGEERIEIPNPRVGKRRVTLAFPHYDSTLELRFSHAQKAWSAEGTWVKQRSGGRIARIMVEGAPAADPGSTRHGAIHFEPELVEAVAGRWAFELDRSGTGVADIRIDRHGNATASIRTTVDDFRYLAGRLDPRLPRRDDKPVDPQDTRPPGTLYLSTFDGAHMFAFVATIEADGQLWGSFHSGDWWVEGFTAEKDPDAALPPLDEETIWTGDASFEEMIFTDLNGRPSSVAELIRAAHADNPDGVGPTILQAFGSWCPNCHDAAAYLVELKDRYGPRGLRVAGLSFEILDDTGRSIRQVRHYLERHGADWPVLVCGLADKDEASAAMPVLDRIRSFPTTIFIDAGGNVTHVYSGFRGPATGAEHEKLRSDFESWIEAMLADG